MFKYLPENNFITSSDVDVVEVPALICLKALNTRRRCYQFGTPTKYENYVEGHLIGQIPFSADQAAESAGIIRSSLVMLMPHILIEINYWQLAEVSVQNYCETSFN
jgi:hypothetical protein